MQVRSHLALRFRNGKDRSIRNLDPRGAALAGLSPPKARHRLRKKVPGRNLRLPPGTLSTTKSIGFAQRNRETQDSSLAASMIFSCNWAGTSS